MLGFFWKKNRKKNQKKPPKKNRSHLYISSSENDTLWIKSEVRNEFDSIHEDLNLAGEISVKFEQEEIDSTSFPLKIEDDVELNSHKEEKSSKFTPCEKKWFNCSYCEYRSNYRTTLIRHERGKHSSDKSDWFKCSYCEYRSIEKRSLVKHEKRKHTADKSD